MKVDGSISSLLQGVSQQPPGERLVGQCTLQENLSADPLDGLIRRAPTDLVGLLGTTADVRGWHNFESRGGEKFLAFFYGSTVKVFDLNAVEQSVTVAPDAAAYIGLNGALRFSTNDQDETIVVNRAAVPAMAADVPAYYNDASTPAGIFQILGGQYGRNIKILIDGVVKATYAPGDGSNAAHTAHLRTTTVAANLATVLPMTNGSTSGQATNNGGTMTTGWTITVAEDVVLIKRNTTTPFNLSATDDFGNVNVKAMTNVVPRIEDLPRLAPHLYVVRVAERTDPEKDLYFKFVVEDLQASDVPDVTAFGRPGYWQECVAPSVPIAFNDATMPHTLTYNSGTDDFDFTRGDWEDRHVGTLVSSPEPSFVGNTIQDVSTFQGRTVFLSGSNVVMSRTNKPTDFWQGSAAGLADDDPIDINSKKESSTLLSAIQHNRDLVVFSAKGQFVVYGRTAATPRTAALVLTTSFESELNASPASAGRNVFFASNFGRYASIREFYTEGGSDTNDARPVTQHVKKYLLGSAALLTASVNSDMLIVHTTVQQAEFYIYQYIWSDEAKVQAAWSTWKMKHDIVYSFFDEGVVYLVQKVGNEYYLLRMPLDVIESEGVGYPVYLDQRFDVFDCYEAFELPYDYLRLDDLVVVQGENCPRPGTHVDILNIALVSGNYVVTLKEDMNGGDIVVGSRYGSKFRPTMPLMKDDDKNIIGSAKLRIRAFHAHMLDTGEITGRVLNLRGEIESEVTQSARVIGAPDNLVGSNTIADFVFDLPFRQDTTGAEIEFYTDSYMPMTFSLIEWTGQYNKSGKRIAQGGNK